MGIFITWVLFSFIVGFVGSERQIGFGWAFFVSLILSPLIGLIITLLSNSKSSMVRDEVLRKQQEEQKILLEKIETNTKSSSYADELFKLKSLLDSNLITKEEFDREKNILDTNR